MKEVRDAVSAGPREGSARLGRAELSYELLLFDLDGTLLAEDRRVSPGNQEALKRLMAAGVRVGIATGRPFRSAKPYADAVGANGPMIFFNGARVWDPERKEYLFSQDLPREEALLAIGLVRSLPELKDAHINLYIDDEILIERRTERSRVSEVKDGVPHTVVGGLAEWLGRRGVDPVKLMVICEPEALEVLRAELLKRTSGACNLVRSEETYLELTRKGVTKGSALRKMIGHYGIPRAKIVAFGDNLNDLELLQDAGLGVAMGNAHEGLKAVAGRVIGDHSTDSIRVFLREAFPRELSE